MTRVYMKVGLRYQYQNTTFLIQQYIGNDYIQVENLQSGEQQTISLQWFFEAYNRGELCFERPPLHTKACHDQLKGSEQQVPDFTEVPDGPLRDEVKRRLEIMQWVKHLPPEQRNRKGFQALAQELKAKTPETQLPGDLKKRRTLGQAISASSIERWWRDYEASGEDIRALIPKLSARGGKGRKHTTPEVEALIAGQFEVYAKRPKKRSLGEIMDDLQELFDNVNKYREPERQLKLLGKSTISSRIQEASSLLPIRNHRSHSKARQKDMTPPIPKAMRILQMVEIEHTRLPFLLVDEKMKLPIGFPTLTAAIDARSGSILGISVGFEPPNEFAIQNCLLHAILPKKDTRELFGTQHEWVTYGIPEIVVTDQDPPLIGTSLKDACKRLGITLIQRPGRSLWLKDQIERFSGTIIKRLGTQIFGSTNNLSSIIGEPTDPQKHICISLTVFWRILHLFLVDEYAHRWQKRVQGVPYLLWMENIQAGYGPALPWSAKEVRDLLRSNGGKRKIGRKGIEFETLYYHSPELDALKSAMKERASQRAITTGTNEVDGSKPLDEGFVAVKYDPGDLNAIYVRTPFHDDGAWLHVPAVDQEYTRGLTLWQHRVIRKYLAQKQRAINCASLQTTKEAIQMIVEQEFQLTNQNTRAKEKAAHYNGTGTQPTSSVDMTDSAASSTSTSTLNTTPSASVVSDESVVVEIRTDE